MARKKIRKTDATGTKIVPRVQKARPTVAIPKSRASSFGSAGPEGNLDLPADKKKKKVPDRVSRFEPRKTPARQAPKTPVPHRKLVRARGGGYALEEVE